MSFYLAGAAWRAKVAPTTKLVLLCLADTANDDGECWPSIQTICKKTGLSRRAVINHIETLCKEGFLTKTRRTKDNGEQTSNLLKIVCMNPVGSEQDAPGGGAPRAPGSAPNAPGGVHHVHRGGAPRAPEPIKEPISLEPIKEPKDISPDKGRIHYENIAGIFKHLCPSLPRLKKITPARKSAIRNLWEEYKEGYSDPGMLFSELFQKVEASDFLTGRSGRWDSCNFDWVLNPKNALKILEGTYKNTQQQAPQPLSKNSQAHAVLDEMLREATNGMAQKRNPDGDQAPHLLEFDGSAQCGEFTGDGGSVVDCDWWQDGKAIGGTT